MILKRVLLVIMIKIFKDVDDTIGYFKVFNSKNANCYLESPVRRTDADGFRQTTSASVGRICWICAICSIPIVCSFFRGEIWSNMRWACMRIVLYIRACGVRVQ